MRFNSIPMACQQCGAVSYIKPSHAAKGAGKFCSRACMSAFKAEQSTRICEQCSLTFRSPAGRVQKGYGKFCSRVCADLGRTREAVDRTCERCGLTFTVAPFRIAQGSGKFCSTACRDDARRGKPGPLNPNRHTVTFVCGQCGDGFRPNAPNKAGGPQRFCSWECKSASETIEVTIPGDERDLIYFAGLLDGEGTITVNPAFYARMILSNTHEPTVQWIKDTFGGSLSSPRPTRKPNHKPLRTWYAGDAGTVRLCLTLLPYLKIKRRQAEIVLSIALDEHLDRSALLAELRSLNHRGLVLPDSN